MPEDGYRERAVKPYVYVPFVSPKGNREMAKEPRYRKLFFGYELSILQHTSIKAGFPTSLI